MRKIIEEEFTPRYFCSTDGNSYDFPGKCPLCDVELQGSVIHRVPRVCNLCDEEFEATVKYFEAHPNCPDCKDGILEILPPNDTHSFVIDGQWNGVPIGRKVKARNEELKKKHAGYSYENTPSMRETVTQKAIERKNKKG